MKIVTFNIRYDGADDRENAFSFRRELIRARIEREKPDIIGFQEVLPHVARWLRENLSDYTVAGCGRGPDFQDEHMILACRRDSLQLLTLENFWLSPTPEIPGSRYERQSICPRCCAAAMLREEATGRVFRVYATHLDHEDAYAREEGLKLILTRIEAARPALPSVLLGDFNAQPDDPELAPLRECQFLRDVTGSSGPTYHDYGRVADKIDYIALSKEWECRSVKLWDGTENGVYLSDHYPVEAEVFWK